MEKPILQSHLFMNLSVHPFSIHVKLKKGQGKKLTVLGLEAKLLYNEWNMKRMLREWLNQSNIFRVPNFM